MHDKPAANVYEKPRRWNSDEAISLVSKLLYLHVARVNQRKDDSTLGKLICCAVPLKINIFISILF